MAEKALYFPYISTPDSAWFTRALLYWDAIGTIVPAGLHDDPRYVTPRMQELRSAGLLELVEPDRYLNQLDFVDPFLALVDQQVAPDEPWADRAAHVHVGKITGDLLQALCDGGLAKVSERREGYSRWVDVEPRVAALYMAYLAASLGALDEVGMDPLTDRPASLAALAGADTLGSPTLRAARDLRVPVLEALLPAPAEAVTVADLLAFKQANGQALVEFRRFLDRSLIELAAIPDDGARERRGQLLTEDLAAERDRIAAEMAERRWPRIVFGAVAAVFGAGAAVVAPLASGPGLVGPAVALPGLITAVYAAVGELRRRPDFAGRPLAYAALAQRAVGDP